VSSDTRERPESGSIESEELEHLGVTTYISEMDGATVVEIDTSAVRGRLRVYVNEGVVFDQDPEEHGPHGECGYVFRSGDRAHRCGVMGAHPGRPHVCRHCVVAAL
jgi:hypothetical protein